MAIHERSVSAATPTAAPVQLRTSSAHPMLSPGITPDRSTSPSPLSRNSSVPSPAPANAPPPSPRRHKKALSTSVADKHRRTLSAVDEDRARDPHVAVEDLRSLRSSGRRRLRALRDLECALAAACTGDDDDMEAFVALQAHVPLLSLLGRHTASLAKRASTSSLPAGDELARHLAPEIDIALSLLQGLTLLSKACKAAVGERWTLEMFLDLLLLLRTQPPEGTSRPTVYALLDLLFCVLVDNPDHARMFEDLQGLEAVTRVLRGTGVAKDVRMKCCEFLYFYLLPEGSTTMPDAYNLPGLPGSRSTSSSSSTSGSAFSGGEIQSALPSPTHSRVSSVEPRPVSPERWNDLSDLPFVPQTPRKPAKPSLGFQTPSANRRTSGSSSVTVLTPVAQSPDERKSRDDSDGQSSSSNSARRTPLDGLPGPRDVSTGSSLNRVGSKRTKSPFAAATPPTPSRRHSRSQSATPLPGRERQRSRGFPSELTRGQLPTPTPLSPSRRITGTPDGTLKKGGSIRSVAEKKEMLGMWLGNVDQLVQGVEKVGFWAKKDV